MKVKEEAILNELLLQSALNREARSAMDAARDKMRLGRRARKAYGYKSNVDAVLGVFKFYNDRMDNLIKDHLKKYPESEIRENNDN